VYVSGIENQPTPTDVEKLTIVTPQRNKLTSLTDI